MTISSIAVSKKISAMIGNTVSKIDLAVEYDGNRLSNIPLMAGIG
jgi:hypothetical protein